VLFADEPTGATRPDSSSRPAVERLARLRELGPAGNATDGIDPADVKQAIVVTDQDSQVLARRRLLYRVWQSGEVGVRDGAFPSFLAR
jgi:hypothetical protein